MMRRTVYQFICTQHAQVLDGKPEMVLDPENNSWHVDITTMTCPRTGRGILDDCVDTWTNRTCEHLHPQRKHGDHEHQRCNSMTCWNYRHLHMWKASDHKATN